MCRSTEYQGFDRAMNTGLGLNQQMICHKCSGRGTKEKTAALKRIPGKSVTKIDVF